MRRCSIFSLCFQFATLDGRTLNKCDASCLHYVCSPTIQKWTQITAFIRTELVSIYRMYIKQMSKMKHRRENETIFSACKMLACNTKISQKNALIRWLLPWDGHWFSVYICVELQSNQCFISIHFYQLPIEQSETKTRKIRCKIIGVHEYELNLFNRVIVFDFICCVNISNVFLVVFFSARLFCIPFAWGADARMPLTRDSLVFQSDWVAIVCLHSNWVVSEFRCSSDKKWLFCEFLQGENWKETKKKMLAKREKNMFMSFRGYSDPDDIQCVSEAIKLNVRRGLMRLKSDKQKKASTTLIASQLSDLAIDDLTSIDIAKDFRSHYRTHELRMRDIIYTKKVWKAICGNAHLFKDKVWIVFCFWFVSIEE